MYSEFFHAFIKRGLLEAVGNRPDYWVMLNAANWMDKGALTEADLLEIQAAIDAKNTMNTMNAPADAPDADAV